MTKDCSYIGATFALVIKQPLSCHFCVNQVADLDLCLVAWDCSSDSGHFVVTDVFLSHKECFQDALPFTAEAAWFGHALGALYQLARLAEGYDWPWEPLQQLTRLAWLIAEHGADQKPRATLRSISRD